MDGQWKCYCGFLNEGLDPNCLTCGADRQMSELAIAERNAQESSRFQAQRANPQTHQTVQTPAKSFQAPMRGGIVPPEVESIASLQQLDAVAWMVIGIIQCICIVFFLVGLWNIYAATSRFRKVQQIRLLNPGIPGAADRELGGIILFIFVNLFFGGVIGVIGCIVDLVLREKILKARHLFEGQQVTAVANA